MDNLSLAKELKEKYLSDAELLIIKEIKRIMKIHKNLISFSDCRGLHVFTDNKNESIYLMSETLLPNYSYIYVPTHKTFSILCDMYAVLLDNYSLGITILKD